MSGGFQRGDIIWAKVPDKNGYVKPDPRPLIVLLSQPSPQAKVDALAISTRTPNAKDETFPVPWDAQTGDCTGLRKPCFVVLRWALQVDPNDIESVSGRVPEKTMLQLDTMLYAMRTRRRSQ